MFRSGFLEHLGLNYMHVGSLLEYNPCYFVDELKEKKIDMLDFDDRRSFLVCESPGRSFSAAWESCQGQLYIFGIVDLP